VTAECLKKLRTALPPLFFKIISKTTKAPTPTASTPATQTPTNVVAGFMNTPGGRCLSGLPETVVNKLFAPSDQHIQITINTFTESVVKDSTAPVGYGFVINVVGVKTTCYGFGFLEKQTEIRAQFAAALQALRVFRTQLQHALLPLRIDLIGSSRSVMQRLRNGVTNKSRECPLLAKIGERD
jgi:hypothetical protein